MWYTHRRLSKPPDHCNRRTWLGESRYDYVTVRTNLFSTLSVKKINCLTSGLNNTVQKCYRMTQINHNRFLSEIDTNRSHNSFSLSISINRYGKLIFIDY